MRKPTMMMMIKGRKVNENENKEEIKLKKIYSDDEEIKKKTVIKEKRKIHDYDDDEEEMKKSIIIK